MREYQLFVLGSESVGKTSLTQQYALGMILVDATIEDSYTKQVQMNDEQCFLGILDLSVKDEFYQVIEDCMRKAQGFVLVYSITSQSSFDELSDIRDDIIKVRDTNSDFPMVLVGNKCDLEDERVIAKDQGEALAKQFGNCTFLEASAKANINVSEIFLDLVRQIDIKTAEERESRKSRRNRFKCVVL